MPGLMDHPARESVRTWTNGSSETPGWVTSHQVGPWEPNGTLIIQTSLGEVRVHPTNVVVEHLGVAFVCEGHEIRGLIDRLLVETEMAPAFVVGPGKSLDQSGAPLTRPSRKKSRKRPQAYAPPTGTMPTIEWLHISRLSTDASYQRSIDNEASRRLITNIAARFDWRLCVPLVVSRRAGGELVVIDGQHRTMAAQKRGDILQLPCCVFSYESPEEEARMFIMANRARKPMNRLDDFHAALAAADEDAIEMQMLVTDAGLKVARNAPSTGWKPKEIAFTATIATSIRRYGPALVSAALTNLAEAFPTQRLTRGGTVFLGLVKLLHKSPDDFDADLMFDVLKQRSLEDWGLPAVGLVGSEARASLVRRAMIDAYGIARQGLPADSAG